MIFAWLGAIVVGLAMGLLGSGGSIMTVPILVYLLGHPEKQAISEAFVIVGTIALLSSIPYAANRNIHFKSVILLGIPGMIGAVGGQFIARFVPGDVQLVVLALLMAVSAYKMLRPGTLPDVHDAPQRPALKIALDGLAIGLVTGLVGVGGGFLLVPVLVLMGGLSIHMAIGTSVTIIAMNCASGFANSLAVVPVRQLDWHTVAIFAGIGALGSMVGISIGPKLNQRALRRAFGAFLVVMAVFIGVREVTDLIGARADSVERSSSANAANRPQRAQSAPSRYASSLGRTALANHSGRRRPPGPGAGRASASHSR